MHERITCERIEIGLGEYLERALPTVLQRSFRSHLSACAECRQALRGIRWIIDRLAELERAPMPLHMKNLILRRARQVLPRATPLGHGGAHERATMILGYQDRSRRA